VGNIFVVQPDMKSSDRNARSGGYRRKRPCPSRKTCISGGRTNGLNTDKGEVGGSSPPRPTINHHKYAIILTVPS
jgi:hypothetical protein